MAIRGKFSGSVVAEPERKQVGQQTVLEFPVYDNETKKDRDTGEYVKTGDVTKVRVTLWGDLANQDIRKGDIVELDTGIIEKTYQKRDGTEGRSLQTAFVNSVVVKWRNPDNDGGNAAQSSGGGGFGSESAGFGGGGFGSAPSGGF